jgi:hypothetical protein
MAHIADLYNNGRTGQHRSINQARAGYAELIQKEGRVADAAYTRKLLEAVDVRCPKCRTQVATARCHMCHYFPIKLPSAAELNEIEQRLRMSKSQFGAGNSSSGSVAALGGNGVTNLPPIGGKRGGVGNGAPSSAASGCSTSVSQRSVSTASTTRRKHREELEEKVAALEKQLANERSTQTAILSRIGQLQELMSTTISTPSAGSTTPAQK